MYNRIYTIIHLFLMPRCPHKQTCLMQLSPQVPLSGLIYRYTSLDFYLDRVCSSEFDYFEKHSLRNATGGGVFAKR